MVENNFGYLNNVSCVEFAILLVTEQMVSNLSQQLQQKPT